VSGGGASSTGSGSSKYRCGEIGSWSRAQDLLKQGHTYLDRDGDGEACESLKDRKHRGYLPLRSLRPPV
jgi:hypothetical protein